MELWWYVFYVVCTKVHPDTPGQGVNNVNDQNNANRVGGGGGELEKKKRVLKFTLYAILCMNAGVN